MSLRVTDLRSELSLVVTHHAVTVAGTDSLKRAGQLMGEHNVSALLVDPGQAIISEQDMARALAAGLGPDDQVLAIASRQPITVGADMAIIDAAALMLNEKIRHLVVRLPDQRLGIVSLRTIMAVLLQATTPKLWLERLRLHIDLAGSGSCFG